MAIKVVLPHTPLAMILKSSMSTWPRCQEGHILQNSPAYPGQNDSKVPINPLGLSILSKPPACPHLSPPQHLVYQTASCFIKRLSSWMPHSLLIVLPYLHLISPIWRPPDQPAPFLMNFSASQDLNKIQKMTLGKNCV